MMASSMYLYRLVGLIIDLIDYVYRIGNFNVIEWVRGGQRL